MKKKTFCLRFTESDREYLFEDKVFVIEDKKLIDELTKPSIKNVGSSLIIKSLDNTPIYDVVQIKVRLSDTGYLLANFKKESLSETQKGELINEISSLKCEANKTNSTQLKKVIKLIEILRKYKPIYATFVINGIYEINLSKVSALDINFPILVVKENKKRFTFQLRLKKAKEKKEPIKQQIEEKIEEKPAKKPEKNVKTRIAKPKQEYTPFDLFDFDYVFILLFALLGAFGILSATFEIMNKQTIAIFLSILGLAFVIVLAIAVYSALYRKGKLLNPYLRYYLCFFIIIGIAAGIIGGYFVCKSVLKPNSSDFDYKKCIIISAIISIVTLLSSVSTSRLINIFWKKRHLNKKD